MLQINKNWVTASMAVTYLLLGISTLTKLLFIPYIEAKFQVLGIAEYGRILGFVELAAFLLYLFPGTMGLGFVLLCSYFGGAIAIDLHAPQFLYQPVVVLTLLFITTYIRKPSIYSDKLTAIQNNCCTVIAWNKDKQA